MARTRARGRVDGAVTDSSASESELVIASSSAGEGSAIPSESEGETTRRRASPRKRDTSITTNDATTTSTITTSTTKRPFKPARSARKTTNPVSSAAKKRALQAFANDETTSESEDELAINSSTSRLAVAPFSHRDISDSEDDDDERQLETANASQRRIATVDTNTTEDEEEEEGDETIWVPVRSASISNGSSLKRKNAPSSSSRRDGSGTPKAGTTGTLSLRQLARQARRILENAMEDDAVHLSLDDKDTLSSFLSSMQPSNGVSTNEHDTRIERVLLDTFELSTKQAGPDFSIVELIDIVTYLLLFSDTEDAEALKQGLPVAIGNFASSIVPLGMKLGLQVLELQLKLKIQLVLARARVASEILEEDNEDLMDDDQDLALRYVDNGQEALWDEYSQKAARVLATILSAETDIDDLLAEYPYESFLASFLKHVKRVFAHLKRPMIRQGSVIASSPSKYYEHIARKRLKVDQARRQSAPPPQMPQQPGSPYQGLRNQLRQARKSSPVRRPVPMATTSARAFQAIATSAVQENMQQQKYNEDDSDEEVENVLITRSSVVPASEQEEGDALEGRSEENSVQESVNEDDHMVIEQEIIEEEVEVETQFPETQAVQSNLLDRSALGVFLETQIESQVAAQDERQVDSQGDSSEPQDIAQELGDTSQQQEEAETQGFWGNGLASAGGQEAPMHEDAGSYLDIATYAEEEPVSEEAAEGVLMEEEIVLEEEEPVLEEEEESQATQTVPGRSDAPSPSLANPQSFDDSIYDELIQQADEAIDTFEQIVGEEVDSSQVPTPKAVRDASAEVPSAPEQMGGERMEEEEVVAHSAAEVVGDGDVSLAESSVPAAQEASQAPPRRRGRPPKKKADWFAKQDDAEKITMSSPATTTSGTAAKGRVSNTRAARKSTGQTSAATDEEADEANGEGTDYDQPPSARDAYSLASPQVTGSRARTRRKPLQYVETEDSQEEGSDDIEGELEVASTRQWARAKAAKGKGRAKQSTTADPEQATSRVTLPARRGRPIKVSQQDLAAGPSSEDRLASEVDGSDGNDLNDVNDDVSNELSTPERRLAQEMQDEYVDELASEPVEEEEDSAPVASTSAAVDDLPRRRSAPRRAAASTSSSAKTKAKTKAPAATAAVAKGKGKARATSLARSSPAPLANSADAPDDDTLNNDPEQLAEKRRLFAEAIKAYREGLEQSERFLDIKRRYNEIALLYPKYVDDRASAVSTWDASERKTFLVALDLMPNPLANRRFKSVLMDHGINGMVTRNLKNRKSSQLKDKGENIRALHRNAPISNPAFAFFQNALDIDGTIVRKPQRRKKNARGQSVATDDDIEDFQDASEA